MRSIGSSWSRELSRRAPSERAIGLALVGNPVGRDIRRKPIGPPAGTVLPEDYRTDYSQGKGGSKVATVTPDEAVKILATDLEQIAREVV